MTWTALERIRIKESHEAYGNRRVDTVSNILSYEGYAPNGALTSEDKWQIRRISGQGTENVYEYAGNGDFDQVWDDREALFGVVPFFATYSTLFDGINDYVTMGDHLNKERTDSFSWSFWIRISSLAVTNVVFAKRTTPGNGPGISIKVLSTGAIELQVVNTATTNQILVTTANGVIAPNTWYNLVITYAGTSLATGCKCYVNSNSVAFAASINNLSASIATTANAIFGQYASAQFFNGYMDEVSLWNTVLDQTAVTELFNTGSPFDIATHSWNANLTNWWRMGDGDLYPTLIDVVGGKNGSMINMATDAIKEFAP